MLETRNRKNEQKMLALLLVAAFALRLFLSAATEGYPYDRSCFFAWALRLADSGPAGFYVDGYFCDYPPGYLWVLWLVGKVMRALDLNYLETSASVLITLVPALADTALAALVWHIADTHGAGRLSLRFAAAAAFCPVLLFDTAVWKQIDGVFTLLVVLCFWLLEQKKWWAGAALYGLALAVKPQALLVGPVLALCFLAPIFTAADKRARLTGVKKLLLGVICALAGPVLCGLPFWGLGGLWGGLADKYLTTASSYPYATINGFNLMAALGANWTSQTDFFCLGGLRLCTWQQLGTVGVAAASVFVVLLARRTAHAKNGRYSPLLLAGVYAVAVFTLSHRMHERYLIFGAVLIGAAAARFRDKKLLLLAGGLSLTSLLNLALVYCMVGTDDEFLISATSTQMLRVVGFAETLLFVLLAVWVWRLCGGEDAPFANAAKQAAPVMAAPLPPPRWTRGEALALAAGVALTAAVSFAYLGEHTAPETCVDANGTSFTDTITVEGDATALWVYPGIATSNNGRLTVTSADTGVTLLELTLSYGSPFTWTRQGITEAGRYIVTVTDGQIFELAFRGADGTLLAAKSEMGSALVDEQAKVPDTISQLNSFYFDEIYHARTGYETLHGMSIYETTHPPLGKDFIALGILIFGMNAFGWRFFGTLCGVLMVPLLYLFARRLTRRPWLAGVAAALLAFDFMRFSQSRIATIDSYSAFFIWLGAYFMVCYCQSVLKKGVAHSILPMALSGIAFGLGCASKWTGIYAGAGLAVCYFGVLFERGRFLQARGAAAPELRASCKKQLLRETGLALCGGVLFFVLVPVGIYLASYLPFHLHNASFGLADWWSAQESMYRYHSGLEATHAFSSCWYSWLLDLRPVWYYMGGGLPEGRYASIAGFFSPLVCWAGLAAILMLFAKGLAGRASAAQKGVLVFFLSQLLPWLLVTRCTFLYHYFPCLAFLILAIVLCIGDAAKKQPRQAKAAAALLVGGAAVLFVWFYPVLSGLPVLRAVAASLKWLPSWGFYIL